MPNYVERRDYIQMTKEKPEDIRRERECYRQLFSIFSAPFASVLEIFGGAGILREVLGEQKLVDDGTRHEAWDYSERCVDYLAQTFPLSAVRRVDSFNEPIENGWELISADFNSWTFLRYAKQTPYQKLTTRLFESGAAYVQLTDSAVNKMHLNWTHYSRVFGREIGTDAPLLDYMSHLDVNFRARFNYSLLRVAHHANASYLLFQRGRSADDTIVFYPKVK